MTTDELPAACSDALKRHLRADLFKSLCDARRLTLVARLAVASEPLSVSEVANCCGVHISGVSRHLSILRDAGVVTAIKRGREVVYQLEYRSLVSTLRGLADSLEECCTASNCCGSTSTSGEQT